MLCDLEIELEELDDGSDYRYIATSPDLPGLIVAGDTAEEVLAQVPQVASALIASLKAGGNPLPETVHTSVHPTSSCPEPGSQAALSDPAATGDRLPGLDKA